MSTIVTRAGKGSPLTWNEVDSNFTNLNSDKVQSGSTVPALTITTATINGGTITGITDLAVADGGTGASTVADARVNLLPSYTGNNSKVLALNSGATDVEWVTGGGSMVYPSGTGIAVVTSGTSWGTTLTAPSGTIVGTSDTQTLTNKTISADNNTLSGIAASSFVLSNGSGNIDGAAAQKAIPSGVVVGTTDTQTLTNKTLTSPTITTGTTSGKFTFGGAIDETVFAVTGTTPALSPANGTIQTWSLTANSTPTQGTFDAGESMTLMINDTASSFTVTWTSIPVVWVGGSAPTLTPAAGFTVIELWKVGTTVYGALVGQVA